LFLLRCSCNIRCQGNDANRCLTDATCNTQCQRSEGGATFVAACKAGCVARCT
jgi:hypothetical protein